MLKINVFFGLILLDLSHINTTTRLSSIESQPHKVVVVVVVVVVVFVVFVFDAET